MLPTLFVSHGAPTLILDAGETGRFLARLGRQMPKPEAVLCISAHWTTAEPRISAAARPQTIHDFAGFPEPLYRLRYPAPGEPFLARRIAGLLQDAGIPCEEDPTRGFDHGAWVPLMLMFPEAEIPTLQLSVQPRRDARWHYELGRVLAPLPSEGVLILASGGAVHNLSELEAGETPVWAREFDSWLQATLESGNAESVLEWLEAAPEARRAHPTPEHVLPLFVALGAAGERPRVTRVHHGFTFGSISMAAFSFAAEPVTAE